MNRRTLLSTTGIALATPLTGCLTSIRGDESPQPDRPWDETDQVENPDGVHHLYIVNHTDTTEPAWVKATSENDVTVVNGRYELPDERGIKFENVASWETTYTITVAIDGEEPTTLQWETPACGSDSEVQGEGGSRNGYVRVNDPRDDDGPHQLLLVVDQCDAIHGPEFPTGPAKNFELDS